MKASEKECQVENCTNKQRCKSYCKNHYYKFLKRRKCKIENCEKDVHGNDYCVNHYRMNKRHGDPLYMENRTPRLCEVDGCENIHKSNGYCVKHYARFLKYGDVNFTERIIGHNVTSHELYFPFKYIFDRCNNPKNPKYKHYGGRGITVCERWSERDGFLNFLEDMGDKPDNSYSLDRIDNNKGYSPENCRWATHKEQSNNRRDTIKIEFNNKTQSLQEWADELDVSRTTIFNRLKKGWSFEEAITIKPYQQRQKK